MPPISLSGNSNRIIVPFFILYFVLLVSILLFHSFGPSPSFERETPTFACLWHSVCWWLQSSEACISSTLLSSLSTLASRFLLYWQIFHVGVGEKAQTGGKEGSTGSCSYVFQATCYIPHTTPESLWWGLLFVASLGNFSLLCMFPYKTL